MTPGDLNPDARRRVNDLFHQALELNTAQRPEFVRRACEGSDAIAREVLELLEAHEHTDQFVLPPISSAARSLAQAAADAQALVGRQVGQYRVDAILGQGGMGVVYEATDLRLGRVVALKAISPDVTRDAARRERLRREARAAASLSHPGIATVYALEEFDDHLFIAGEFVAGETLRDEAERGPMEPGRLLQTAIELAQALESAHDHGVIHRDLKPENVIRQPSGHVKILDFGLARMRDTPAGAPVLTQEGTLFGTPAYMAPEQIRRKEVDGRSDLFSLGIMLYELLTGEHPFGGADPAETIIAIVEREPRLFRASGEVRRPSGTVRAGLESVIRTLLRKTPAARFASAHELRAALERVQSGQLIAPAIGPLVPASDAYRWWTFHQIATCVFYVLLLIPIWLARRTLGTDLGLPLFLAAVVAVVGAVTLRMHLLFAVTSLPDEFDHQHRSSARWVRATDWLLVAAAAASGLAIYRQNSVDAVILIICAVIALIVSTVIEPATARAAFGRKISD